MNEINPAMTAALADPMVNPMAWFDGTQWSIVEKLRAADTQTIHRLLIRIQELEGVLVYVRNFLPTPLKEHAEAILFPPDPAAPLKQSTQ